MSLQTRGNHLACTSDAKLPFRDATDTRAFRHAALLRGLRRARAGPHGPLPLHGRSEQVFAGATLLSGGMWTMRGVLGPSAFRRLPILPPQCDGASTTAATRPAAKPSEATAGANGWAAPANPSVG